MTNLFEDSVKSKIAHRSGYKTGLERNTNLNISLREHQILTYIAAEYTSQEIADLLYLSHHTIISHRKNLLIKLGVRNSAGLVRRGFEIGALVLMQ